MREPRSRDESTTSKTNRPLQVLTHQLPNHYHNIQEKSSDNFLRLTTATVITVPEQTKRTDPNRFEHPNPKGFQKPKQTQIFRRGGSCDSSKNIVTRRLEGRRRKEQHMLEWLSKRRGTGGGAGDKCFQQHVLIRIILINFKKSYYFLFTFYHKKNKYSKLCVIKIKNK